MYLYCSTKNSIRILLILIKTKQRMPLIRIPTVEIMQNKIKKLEKVNKTTKQIKVIYLRC